jgi:hypothetical protein
MFDLMALAIRKGVVENQGEWCEKIGIRQTNLSNIRYGDRSFTIPQILAAAELMNKPMDWFFDRNVITSPVEMIAEGLRLIEGKEANPKKVTRKKK